MAAFRFTPGMKRPEGAGRKLGQQNRATQEIRTFARKLLNDRDYLKNLRKALKDLSLDPGLIRMLYQYGYGRPPEKLELSGPDGGPIRANVQIYLPDNGRDRKTT